MIHLQSSNSLTLTSQGRTFCYSSSDSLCLKAERLILFGVWAVNLPQLPAQPGTDLVLETKHGEMETADFILNINSRGRTLLAHGKASPASSAALAFQTRIRLVPLPCLQVEKANLRWSSSVPVPSWGPSWRPGTEPRPGGVWGKGCQGRNELHSNTEPSLSRQGVNGW